MGNIREVISLEKVALVTGAGKGMGFEFVKQLLALDYKVIATARNIEKYPELIHIANENLKLINLNLDVGNMNSVSSICKDLCEVIDHIDLVVNCAGINSKSNIPYSQASSLKFGSLEQESLLNQFKVNTIGPILLVQQLMPLLNKSKKARILNISSWLGSISIKNGGGNYGYCASKSALNMMNKALANDLNEYGILSVNFNPGWVRTDMGGINANLSPEESVGGMLKTILKLDLKDTGKFFQWDGSEHPW